MEVCAPLAIVVTNVQSSDYVVIVEPWATEYRLAPGATLHLTEKDGDPTESIEVHLGDNVATFFARRGGIVTVYQDGVELP